MKFPIECSCGHTHTFQLFGPHKDRDRKAAWLASQDCPDCRKQAEAKAAAEANAAAAVANADAGLPALQGSPKQIAWAESIRAALVAEIDRKIEKGRAFDPNHPSLLEIEGLAAVAKAQTSASWWIDRRSESGMGVLRVLKVAANR